MPIPYLIRKQHYSSAEWHAARLACLDRAGRRCEHCGLRHGAKGWRDRAGAFHHARGPAWRGKARNHKVVLVQLGVAHLNHTPGDDRPENLKALCRRCHLLNDKGFHRETRAARKDLARPILNQFPSIRL